MRTVIVVAMFIVALSPVVIMAQTTPPCRSDGTDQIGFWGDRIALPGSTIQVHIYLDTRMIRSVQGGITFPKGTVIRDVWVGEAWKISPQGMLIFDYKVFEEGMNFILVSGDKFCGKMKVVTFRIQVPTDVGSQIPLGIWAVLDDTLIPIPTMVLGNVFVGPNLLPGDATQDSVLNSRDIMWVLDYVSAKEKPTASVRQLLAADVDGSSEVDIHDGILMAQRIIGKIPCFPIYDCYQPPWSGDGKGSLTSIGEETTLAFSKGVSGGELTIELPPGVSVKPAVGLAFSRLVPDAEGKMKFYFIGNSKDILIFSGQRASQVKVTGKVDNHIPVIVIVESSSGVTGIEKESSVPEEFSLDQNFPNPFNPSTSISFVLREKGHVALKVYNALGQEVALLIDEEKSAGRHSVSFDANGFPSGIFIYRLHTERGTLSRKMILTR